MTDQRYQDEETPVLTGPAPAPEVENPLVPVSLAATLTKAEIDQQIATAHAWPRSPARARDMMISLATLDDKMAEECIYSVPRGGKQIRGPSIRFAEIVLSAWGNVRCAARVTHEDRIERYVEAEALVHDLESNVGYVARARRRIELKRGRKSVDADMIQIAGAAATSVARRNAILGAIPKTVWRRALESVESVIRGDVKTLVERRDAAIEAFNKAGVSTERILKALEVNHLDDIGLEHLVDLTGMKAAVRSGDTTLDQLFPEERAAGPTPETLEEKLKAISKVDPQTGEITEAIKDAMVTGQGFLKDGRRLAPEDVLESGGTSPSDGAGAAVSRESAQAAPASHANVATNFGLPMTPDEERRANERMALAAGAAPPRAPRTLRKPTIDERLQKEGDDAAAKGLRAFEDWLEFLNSDEIARVTSPMEKRWREIAEKPR